MQAYVFKMYISAVFSHINMNFTSYSAPFTTSGTEDVAVWMFGPVGAIASSFNDLTIWVTLRLHFPRGNGSLLNMFHFNGLLKCHL